MEGEVGYEIQTGFSLIETLGTTPRAHLLAKELKEIALLSPSKSGSLHISQNYDGSRSSQGSDRELRYEHGLRSQDTAVVITEWR